MKNMSKRQKDRIEKLRLRMGHPEGKTMDEKLDDWEKTVKKLYWAGGLQPSERLKLKNAGFGFGKPPARETKPLAK
jgi:hypothetical protein